MKNIGRLAFVAFVAFALVACGPIGKTTPNKPSIAVSATGQVTVRPTHATISASLITQSSTAKNAITKNNRKMETIIATLEKAEVPRRFIKTDQIDLQPEFQRKQGKSQITGYTARNTVRVENERISQLGQVLDAMNKAGVNNIDAPEFIVEDIKTQLNWARSEAITEAQNKAKIMADAASVELGPLLSLTEQQIGPPNQTEKDAKYTFPHSGEHTVKIQVDLKYEIKN